MHTSNLSRQESIKRLNCHLQQNPDKAREVAINFCDHNLRLAHENRKLRLEIEILHARLIQPPVKQTKSAELPGFLQKTQNTSFSTRT